MHAQAATARSPSTWPRPIAATSRFVIVDDFEIRGGGIVREALPDRQTRVREKVLLRELQVGAEHHPAGAAGREVQPAAIAAPDHRRRARRDRKGARARSSRPGCSRTAGWSTSSASATCSTASTPTSRARRENRSEHLRRLGEVANLMLDAGVILIVTAAELTQDDLELIKTTVDPDRIETVWVGDQRHDRPGLRPDPGRPGGRDRGRRPDQAAAPGQGRAVPAMVSDDRGRRLAGLARRAGPARRASRSRRARPPWRTTMRGARCSRRATRAR